jgi:PDZ domain/PASTA domain
VLGQSKAQQAGASHVRSRLVRYALPLAVALLLAAGVAAVVMRDRWMPPQPPETAALVSEKPASPAPSQTPPAADSAAASRETAAAPAAPRQDAPREPAHERTVSPRVADGPRRESERSPASRLEPASSSAVVSWLGMKASDARDASTDSARAGALVTDLKPAGAAAKAGLLIGDLVVGYDSRKITSHGDLVRSAEASDRGDRVVIRVLRDNAGRTFELLVGESVTTTRGSSVPKPTPDVVGQSLERARETLSRAGFDVVVKYTDYGGPPGAVTAQSDQRDPGSGKVSVLLDVVVTARVLVYYAADADWTAANALASSLRDAVGDPQYAIRAFKSSRLAEAEGEVRYSASGLEPLAARLAATAGSWLSSQRRQRVTFTPTVDPRVSQTAVIVVWPARPGSSTETATSGGTRAKPDTTPSSVPDVMGQPIAPARELLVRAGFAIDQRYVEGQRGDRPGTVVYQGQPAVPAGGGRRRVALHVVITAKVLLYYARSDEQETAEGLAEYLRQWVDDPQYLIKPVQVSRGETWRGEIRYGMVGLDGLVTKLASGATGWLSRRYGGRVGFSRVQEPRMSAAAVVLVGLPDRNAIGKSP